MPMHDDDPDHDHLARLAAMIGPNAEFAPNPELAAPPPRRPRRRRARGSVAPIVAGAFALAGVAVVTGYLVWRALDPPAGPVQRVPPPLPIAPSAVVRDVPPPSPSAAAAAPIAAVAAPVAPGRIRPAPRLADPAPEAIAADAEREAQAVRHAQGPAVPLAGQALQDAREADSRIVRDANLAPPPPAPTPPIAVPSPPAPPPR